MGYSEPHMRGPMLALLLLAALLAAGCSGSGSNSKDAFGDSVVETRNAADNALAHITDNPSGKEELIQRMDEAAQDIDVAAESLERKDPPEDLQDEQKRLVKSYRQLSVDLATTADQLREPDFQGVLQGTQGLSFQSWVDVNNTLARLKRQGIDVEPLGRH